MTDKMYNGWNNGRDTGNGVGVRPVDYQTDRLKTKEMTPEQLMIPRVLCIGTEPGTPNYPGSPVKSGQILTLFSIWFYENKEESTECHKQFVEPFKNLFRPMPWWEARKPGEMPGYISQSGYIGRAKNWEYCLDGWYFMYENVGNVRIEKNSIPAIEEEYLQYKNKYKGNIKLF